MERKARVMRHLSATSARLTYVRASLRPDIPSARPHRLFVHIHRKKNKKAWDPRSTCGPHGRDTWSGLNKFPLSSSDTMIPIKKNHQFSYDPKLILFYPDPNRNMPDFVCYLCDLHVTPRGTWFFVLISPRPQREFYKNKGINNGPQCYKASCASK